MTTWTIPVSEHTAEQASYYEDLYHKLKSERDETTQRLNDANDANRTLRTKCAMLETFRKKVMDGEVDKGQLAASFGSMSKNDKNSYDDLFKAYDILQRQHRSLISKNKTYVQQITKLKKENRTVRLRFGAPHHLNNRASKSIIEPNNGDSVDKENAHHTNNRASKSIIEPNDGDSVDKENVERANVDNALTQLQMRLKSAEEQLTALRSDPLAAERKATNVRFVTMFQL
jgi:hypothetical protein